jgi:hypothetical protein
MPAATLETDPVFLQFVTTEPGGGGNVVRILAERISPSPCGDTQFDRFISGARLTLAQAQMTGLTNTQLENADELDVVLEDLLEFSHGATHWVAPAGNAARELLRNAALASGLPRFPAPPVIGIDELAGVVWPTRSSGGDGTANAAIWHTLLAGLLKLPLPLLSEMNWLLARTRSRNC